MTKRNLLLIFIALVFAGVYVCEFTNWFKPEVIHIISTNQRSTRSFRARNNPGFLARFANLANAGAAADSPTVPIMFKLGRPYKLTELKVVNLDEWQTNKTCLPLWHLIADTNSVPFQGPFYYGRYIPGMKSVVPGEHAQPLQPGVKYRINVTDGSAKGEHDFLPIATPVPAPANP